MLLPSPTREKLEPVVPRRRDESKETREEIQPRAKSSPKNSPRAARSQSLGPAVAERRSPKRQPVRAPSVTKDSKVGICMDGRMWGVERQEMRLIIMIYFLPYLLFFLSTGQGQGAERQGEGKGNERTSGQRAGEASTTE